MHQRSACAMAEAIAAKEARRKALREKKQRMLEEGSVGDITTSSGYSDSAANSLSVPSHVGVSCKPSLTPSTSSSSSSSQQQQQSQSQQTASGSGYIKTLESQVQTLLTGLGKELKALEQHEVDLKAIVVVHTDRAKARHTSQNETGTLISLRRIHRTNQELQQLHQGMHYLQEERTKIQALLQECESVRTNNDKKKKLLQSVLQVKLSDHVAKVKQLLAVYSTSSFSSIDENTPPSSSPEAEQDEVTDEELLKQFASSLQGEAEGTATASQ